MQTEKGFFSTVLKLHESYMNFTALLTSQGIFPSSDHVFKVYTSCVYPTLFTSAVYMINNNKCFSACNRLCVRMCMCAFACICKCVECSFHRLKTSTRPS